MKNNISFKRKDIPVIDTHCFLVDVQYSYIRNFLIIILFQERLEQIITHNR